MAALSDGVAASKRNFNGWDSDKYTGDPFRRDRQAQRAQAMVSHLDLPTGRTMPQQYYNDFVSKYHHGPKAEHLCGTCFVNLV